MYLKGHVGEPIIIDRRERAESIPAAYMTMGLSVQPAVIQALGEKAALRGRGLTGRFLFAVPELMRGFRDMRAPRLDTALTVDWTSRISDLLTFCDELSVFGDARTVLEFTGEAADAFLDWQVEIEAMLRPGAVLDEIPDWGNKLAGQTARVAAILHLLEHGKPGLGMPVSLESLDAAIEIARYLIPHALKVVLVMDEKPELARANKALEWIGAQSSDVFTTRELHRGAFRNASADDVRDVLRTLVERGWLVEVREEHVGRGRPPAPKWRLVQRASSRVLAVDGPVERSGDVSPDVFEDGSPLPPEPPADDDYVVEEF